MRGPPTSRDGRRPRRRRPRSERGTCPSAKKRNAGVSTWLNFAIVSGFVSASSQTTAIASPFRSAMPPGLVDHHGVADAPRPIEVDEHRALAPEDLLLETASVTCGIGGAFLRRDSASTITSTMGIVVQARSASRRSPPDSSRLRSSARRPAGRAAQPCRAPGRCAAWLDFARNQCDRRRPSPRTRRRARRRGRPRARATTRPTPAFGQSQAVAAPGAAIQRTMVTILVLIRMSRRRVP